ncbi:uncharacterized protein C11orf91 homolog [Pelodytes ibericus]
MSNASPLYFPSLYDRNASNSPENTLNILQELGLCTKDHTSCPTQETSPWPPGLADIPYEPVWFFSTPMRVCYVPRASQVDLELCELEIKIKGVELLAITGDSFDLQKSLSYLSNGVREGKEGDSVSLCHFSTTFSMMFIQHHNQLSIMGNVFHSSSMPRIGWNFDGRERSIGAQYEVRAGLQESV